MTAAACESPRASEGRANLTNRAQDEFSNALCARIHNARREPCNVDMVAQRPVWARESDSVTEQHPLKESRAGTPPRQEAK